MKKLIIPLLISFFINSLYATDYYVDTSGSNTTGDGTSGNPWKTITYALSQISGTGHTVYVAAGTYDTLLGETFPIVMKNGVSLVGAGIDTSIIDANNSDRVIECISIVDHSTRIEGFSIKNGTNTNGGGGIYITAGSCPVIYGNIIKNNNVPVTRVSTTPESRLGGGIYILNSSPEIKNNQIIENWTGALNLGYTGSGGWGGGIAVSGASSSPVIESNIITDNQAINTSYASAYGGGIFIGDGASATIVNNTISENHLQQYSATSGATRGGGIYISGAGTITIMNNAISGNTASAMYGSVSECSGIFVNGSSPTINYNTVTNNDFNGISLSSSSSATIVNNTISDNNENGINISSASPDSVINNIISQNSQYGIYESDVSSDPGKVWYNLFYANGYGLYYDEGTTDYYTASSLNSIVAECENNIDGDPVFVDRNNGDYNLQLSSPAIDAGDPDTPDDPDDTRADIGALYYDQHIEPPQNLIAAPGNQRITLIWNPNSEPDVNKYKIYRDTLSPANILIDSVEGSPPDTFFVDNNLTNHKTYYYRITAVNIFGKESGFSNEASEMPYDITSDSLALVALYDSTNGDNWIIKTNWKNGPVSTWHGVTVSNGGVRNIELDHNNLSGTIPAYIGGIDSLLILHLSENQISGSIPSEIGDLSNLGSLSFANNKLSGTIPITIGNLTNLQDLWLHNNQLTGSIPIEIFNLTNLKKLYLSTNQLTGSIPPEIGNLTNLNSLHIGNNQLTGSIPIEIGNLTNLQDLWLHNNQLTGSIPPEIGNLVNLTALELEGNQLTGSIPPEIGNLINLNELLLNDNQLSGSIPSEIGNLTNFGGQLVLCSNQLTGSIPPELGNLINIGHVDISGNQLTGSIPPQIGNLTNLRGLHLTLNQLSGSIPAEIGNLTNLKDLCLTGNQLSGAIPPEILNLTNLELLLLTDNKLSDLPDLSSLDSLKLLYIDNNFFTFEDIEPNLNVASETFTYSPQGNVGEEKDTIVKRGSNVCFEANVGGDNNQYQWYKNGAAINGATNNSYCIGIVDYSDAGSYTCEITNTLATELTLYTNPVNLIVVDSNLMAFYPFTKNANDSSGNNNHGTVYGATLAKDRFGNDSSAYSFDGEDDYIEIPSNDYLHFSENDFTVSCWFKWKGGDGELIQIGGYGTCAEYRMFIENNKLKFTLNGTGNCIYDGYPLNNELTLNLWYFISVIRNGNDFILYLNGDSLANFVSNSDALVNSGMNPVIGQGDAYFNGIIDDIRVFNKALTNNEIEDLYSERDYSPPNAPQNLLSIQTLNDISLTWNRNTESDLLKYNIYRDTAENNFTLYDSVTGEAPDTFYTDVNTEKGKIYFYKVTSVDSSGIESYYAEIVSSTLSSPREHVPDENTVLLLHFNEIKGYTVYDFSGYWNNGYITGTTIVEGIFGKALNFNGTSDYISVLDHPSLRPSSQITIEAWIKPEDIHTNPYYEIYRKDDGDNRQILSFQEYGTILSFGLNIGGDYDELDININYFNYEGQWVHVAAVYDGENKIIYRNGLEIGRDSATGIIAFDNYASAIIGSFNGNNEFFNGIIDEIRISNKARTPEEFNIFYPPQNLTLNAQQGQINLNWDAATENGVNKYYIYRDTLPNETTLYDSVNRNPPDTFYIDNNLTLNKTYYYHVTAIDSFGDESILSEEVNVFYNTIIVDGIKDPFWETATGHIYLDTSNLVWGEADDNDDISADLYLAYDTSYLYGFIEVKDDSVLSKMEGEWWHSDAISLYFDLIPDSIIPVPYSSWEEPNYRDITSIYFSNLNNFNNENTIFSKDLTDSGYVFEFAINKSGMTNNKTEPPETVILEKGVQVGFHMAITDQENEFEWEDAVLGWGHYSASMNSYRDVTQLGSLTFMDDNQIQLSQDNLVMDETKPYLQISHIHSDHIIDWNLNEVNNLPIYIYVNDPQGLDDIDSVWIEGPSDSYSRLYDSESCGDFAGDGKYYYCGGLNSHYLTGIYNFYAVDKTGNIDSLADNLNNILDCPNILTPANYSIVSDTNFIIDWEEVPGATQYCINIYSSPDLNQPSWYINLDQDHTLITYNENGTGENLNEGGIYILTVDANYERNFSHRQIKIAYRPYNRRIVYVDSSNTSGIETGSPEHPFNTIQEGINASIPGDTVLVYPGTYYENVSINDKKIILASLFLTTSDKNYILNTIIDGNQSGSVLRIENCNDIIDINGFTIRNGYTDDNGGGISIWNHSNSKLLNLILKNNEAYTCPGIFMHNNCTTLINNLKILNNIETRPDCCGGGAIGVWDDSKAEVRNTLIANNVSNSDESAAIIDWGNQIQLINVTITNNLFSNTGNILRGDISVENSIIWNNTPNNITNNVSIKYSNIQGEYSGIGNIDADPMFVDTANGDYRLQANSPCINSGTPDTTGLNIGSFDLQGYLRIYYDTIDMGAYEYNGVPQPEVNDTSICIGEAIPALTATGSNVIWYGNAQLTQVLDSANSYTPEVTIPGTYYYYVTQTIDGNVSAPAKVKFVIHELPIVNLHSDTSICNNDVLTLDAGEGYTYLWSDGSTSQTINVSSADTYSATITDENGCSNSDTMNLSIIPLPDITFNITATECGDSTGSVTIIASGGTGEINYLWETGDTIPTITDLHLGDYPVIIYDSLCAVDTNVYVNEQDAPEFTMEVSDYIICQGEKTVMSVTVDPTIDYTWSPPDYLNTTIGSYVEATPLVSIKYYVQGTSTENGCKTIKSAQITVKPTPQVNLGNDTSICEGETVTLDAGKNDFYKWSDSSENRTLTVSQDGNYSVTVTNISGCQAEDEIVVEVNSRPVVNLGNDTLICEGETITLDAGDGGIYDWSDGSENRTLMISQGNIYSVTVTNIAGCQTIDEITIEVNSLPVVNLGNDTSICEGETVILDAGENDFYNWSDGSSNRTIEAGSSDTYSVTVTSQENCSANDTVNLTVYPLPGVSLGNDRTVCSADSLILDAGEQDSYLWSDGSSERYLELFNSDNYSVSVTVTNEYLCRNSDSVNITINQTPSVPEVPGDMTFCFGEKDPSLTIEGTNVTWYTDNLLQNIVFTGNTYDPEITASGTYTWYVTQTENNCQGPAGHFSLIVYQTPEITINVSDNPIYLSESSTLTVNGYAESYEWYPSTGLDNTTTAQVKSTPIENIEYTIIASTGPCSDTASVMIYVYCEECDQDNIILTSQGILNHGCTNRIYNNNANCSWIIYPSGARSIYLVFDTIDIKTGDFIRIYNGTDTSVQLIGEFNNDNLPSGQIKSGPGMYIHFYSDESETGLGFQARYKINEPLGITEEILLTGLKIYPNPASRIINIEFTSNKNGHLIMNFYNSLGKTVLTKEMHSIIGNNHEKIKLDQLEAGIYYIQICSEEGNLFRKVLIN